MMFKKHILYLFLASYCIYHLFNGNNGLLTYFKIRKEIQVHSQQLARLKEEYTNLECKINLMRPETLCKDLLEEQVRKMIHYAKPEDLIIVTAGQ